MQGPTHAWNHYTSIGRCVSVFALLLCLSACGDPPLGYANTQQSNESTGTDSESGIDDNSTLPTPSEGTDSSDNTSHETGEGKNDGGSTSSSGPSSESNGSSPGDESEALSDSDNADESDDSETSDNNTEPESIRLGTFNAALAPVVVKGVQQRFPAIVGALQNSDLDLVCLQELFNNGVSTEEFGEAIESDFPYQAKMNTGGFLGNGLLIASRVPLSGDPQAFEYSTGGLSTRMVLATQLQFADEPIQILCTHLSAGLHENEIQTRQQEINELLAWVDSQDFSGPTILLGDFNTGPDPIGACTPESDPACLAPDEASLDLLLASFDDPAAESEFCTQCRDFFLPLQNTGNFNNEPDQRIDHCLSKELGSFSIQSVERIFDEAQSIPDGDSTLGTLSDHFGVRCTLSGND